MHKIALDTGVWISALGIRQPKESSRQQKARQVYAFLMSQPARFATYFSQRSEIELAKNPILAVIRRDHLMLPYHCINETLDQVEGTWDNWGTILGCPDEPKFGDDVERLLPDKPHKAKPKINRRDRGIFGDAVFEGCACLLHENPSDFSKFRPEAAKRGIVLVDLLCHTATQVEAMLAAL